MVTETNNMAALPKKRWRLVKAIKIHEIILALKKDAFVCNSLLALIK
jgi:hypothetical protein